MSTKAEIEAFQRELRDMKKCPDCHTTFKTPRELEDRCDPEEVDCESFVTMFEGKLVWHNPNWG